VRPINALPADRMPIGELSRLCGVHIETIRYYEKIGMLPAPPRTESARRVYGPKETRILVFIRRGRELGFTLDQIRALLTLGGPAKASCAESRAVDAVCRLSNICEQWAFGGIFDRRGHKCRELRCFRRYRGALRRARSRVATGRAFRGGNARRHRSDRVW
jgi:DNA-binding transcriptional MerR regulator